MIDHSTLLKSTTFIIACRFRYHVYSFVPFKKKFYTHFKVADVFEDKGVVDVNGLADLVVHGIDVSLVNSHTLLSQGGGVVDGDVMQLWMILPVLI